MHDLEKTLLVHLSKASVYLEGLEVPDGIEKSKTEIDAAIALLTAEKPKRRRQSRATTQPAS